jgi:hypothetical protein
LMVHGPSFSHSGTEAIRSLTAAVQAAKSSGAGGGTGG